MRWGEEPGCILIEALQQKASSLNIKRLCLIKENQISQVKEFSGFLCMGRCKSLGSLKSFFDMHLSYLGPVFSVFHIQVSSGLLVGNDCSLMAARWQVFFPSWVPSGLTQLRWWLQLVITVTSFVYSCSRKHSISQFLPLVWNSTNIWETFRDLLLSHGPGRLISHQVKDPVNMPLQMLILGLGPLIANKRFSGSSVF